MTEIDRVIDPETGEIYRRDSDGNWINETTNEIYTGPYDAVNSDTGERFRLLPNENGVEQWTLIEDDTLLQGSPSDILNHTNFWIVPVGLLAGLAIFSFWVMPKFIAPTIDRIVSGSGNIVSKCWRFLRKHNILGILTSIAFILVAYLIFQSFRYEIVETGRPAYFRRDLFTGSVEFCDPYRCRTVERQN